LLVLETFMSSSNVVWQRVEVRRSDREALLGQRGRLIWLTGLSGSGKSTVASRLEARLCELGRLTYLVDGDNLRHGLCADLGFSEPERRENIRRAGEVSRLMVDAGLIVIVALISPYRADRAALRSRMGAGDFVEVHISTPIEVCEQRDVKGLYARARRGEIPLFTGISSPYEVPERPELVFDTSVVALDDAVAGILSWLGYDGRPSPG
jgi:adenylyl-sulfate kinase